MVRESPQSATVVTLPPELFAEAQRIASEEKWTLGEAVVFLAKCGAESQLRAEKALEESYAQFMADPTSSKCGDDLMRSIFGPDALAKD